MDSLFNRLEIKVSTKTPGSIRFFSGPLQMRKLLCFPILRQMLLSGRFGNQSPFGHMNIPSLPFNQHIGIETCSEPEQGLLQLPEDPKYQNHLGTVHASAIFALGEASSGAFLLEHTRDLPVADYVPVLRRADIKYRTPGEGRIYSEGKYVEEDWQQFREILMKSKRAIVRFPIRIKNDEGKCIAEANYEWFVFENTTKI